MRSDNTSRRIEDFPKSDARRRSAIRLVLEELWTSDSRIFGFDCFHIIHLPGHSAVPKQITEIAFRFHVDHSVIFGKQVRLKFRLNVWLTFRFDF